MSDPRRDLVDLLTRHFDHTRGISDDSVTDAEEIADVILTAGWTPPGRTPQPTEA